MTSISARPTSTTVRHRRRASNFFLLAALIALVFFALSFLGCQPPTDPTPQPAPNIYITNNNGQNQNQTGIQPGGSCAGITGTPVFIADTGTFSGGKMKMGETLVGHIAGLSIPSSCTPTVTVQTLTASCTTPNGLSQTIAQVEITPVAVGSCAAKACVSDYPTCAPIVLDVIS